MQIIKKRLVTFPNQREGFCLLKVFESLFNTQVLGPAGLAISAAASPNVKATNAIAAVANGVLVQAAAGTVMPALAGSSLLNLQYQIWTFTIDGSGVIRVQPGTPALTLAGVQIPLVPEVPVQAVIGSLILYNGSGSTFVPGTTALDTALLVAIYNNTTGPFFPIQIL